MHNHVSIPIEDSSQVGEARRAAMSIANEASLSDVDAGKLSIITTELATNILKHAKNGEILVGNVRGEKTVDVIALDQGPGIGDLQRSMEDGVSTAGTAGHGLGAIRRQSSNFEIYSRPGNGSAVIATVGPVVTNGERFDIGVICRPVRGEVDCGDGWATGHTLSKQQVMVVDGLGHGTDAFAAAWKAMLVFSEYAKHGPTELLNFAHMALRPTRGAALAMADIDLEKGTVRYAGVGNIAATILDNGQTRSLVSHNGTVGAEMRKVQEFMYPWNSESILVMNSDGLTTHWRLDPYPGLQNKSTLMIAAILYRDFKRPRDDSTVLVARERRAA